MQSYHPAVQRGTQMKCTTIPSICWSCFVRNPPPAEAPAEGTDLWGRSTQFSFQEGSCCTRSQYTATYFFPKLLAVFSYSAPYCKLSERLMVKKISKWMAIQSLYQLGQHLYSPIQLINCKVHQNIQIRVLQLNVILSLSNTTYFKISVQTHTLSGF